MRNTEFKTPFHFDLALQEPVFYMMRKGIRIDVEQKEEMLENAHEEWKEHQHRLNTIAGSKLNVNSYVDVRNFIYEDIGLPKRRKKKKVTSNEAALRSLMAYSDQKIDEVKMKKTKLKYFRALTGIKLILLIRGIRKEISSYLDVDADSDNRMRCLMSIGGTETMRFSHSKTLWDTGLNLATVPRKLRTMYIPDEGYELCELDLNRGESWVYAFQSGDPELVRIHSSGGDFHAETAHAIQEAFIGADKEALSVEEIIRLNAEGDQFGYKLRYLGKRVNHASAYRMGPFKGAEVVNEEADDTGITITPSQMKEAQRLWREKYWGIGGWWQEIDSTLEATRHLETPYGRIRGFFGWMSDHLKKEATAYVPQSTSVDYLNYGMLQVFHKLVTKGVCGVELLHQNHDSILVQYPQDRRSEIIPMMIEQLTSELIVNGERISIPVEASYGPNWLDLEKWQD